MQKKRILIFLLVVSTFAFAEVPDVVFKTLNNKNIYLHDYVGEPRLLRPDAPRCGVILIFFHLEDVSLESWLPPLNALIKDFKSSNRKFFFIATSQDVERLNTFQNTCNLSAPLYMDVFNVCANLLDVSSDDLRF
ncbi:MAG: hypothetical protein PHE86_07310, partial [Candidatus Marinimicrobia bacterium]|nr:hypothetical protein [Candidatus Neomarinimicrobiota bacterium]